MASASTPRPFLTARLMVGGAFVIAPARAARGWLGAGVDLPPSAFRYGVGLRDVVLSSGGLYALRRGGDVRPWLRAAAVAEAVDAVAALMLPADASRARRLAVAVGAAALAGTGWRLAAA